MKFAGKVSLFYSSLSELSLAVFRVGGWWVGGGWVVGGGGGWVGGWVGGG